MKQFVPGNFKSLSDGWPRHDQQRCSNGQGHCLLPGRARPGSGHRQRCPGITKPGVLFRIRLKQNNNFSSYTPILSSTLIFPVR